MNAGLNTYRAQCLVTHTAMLLERAAARDLREASTGQAEPWSYAYDGWLLGTVFRHAHDLKDQNAGDEEIRSLIAAGVELGRARAVPHRTQIRKLARARKVASHA